MKSQGQNLTYHYNPHGDVIGISDQDGQTLAQYVYDAWGNIIQQNEQGLSVDNPFKYAGYMHDEETNLYYLMARYYHPTHGVFISVDPDPGDADDPITQNGYTYTNNNPVMGVDPDGHFVWLAINAGFAIKDGYKAYKSGASIAGVAGAAAIGALGLGKLKLAKHTVYVLRDSKDVIRYVGRTTNKDAREKAHKKKFKDLTFDEQASGLSYAQARGLEHRLYLKNGGKKILRNIIRPIRKNNPNYKTYMSESRDIYKKLK